MSQTGLAQPVPHFNRRRRLGELRRAGAFPAVEFPAWKRTRDDLAGAIARGVGMVALVGVRGSGRTWLLATQRRLSAARASSAQGAPAHRLVSMITDDVDLGAIERFAANRRGTAAPARGVQVVAIAPELLAALVAAFPDARVVRMRPMASVDVRTMIEVRREQAGLPAEAMSVRAVLRLEELCEGSPRRLDRLLGRAALVAKVAAAEQLTAEHVDAAARLLRLDSIPPSSPDTRPRLGPARRPPPLVTGVGRPPLRAVSWSGAALVMATTRRGQRVLATLAGIAVVGGLVGAALVRADRPAPIEASQDAADPPRFAAASLPPAVPDAPRGPETVPPAANGPDRLQAAGAPDTPPAEPAGVADVAPAPATVFVRPPAPPSPPVRPPRVIRRGRACRGAVRRPASGRCAHAGARPAGHGVRAAPRACIIRRGRA